MRTFVGVTVVMVACAVVACTSTVTPTEPTAESPSSGIIDLACDDPIGVLAAPGSPSSAVLDAVGLDLTSTLQVGTGSATDPHRLFAKTGLLVHAGREAIVSVPAAWTARVSIAWGNQAAVWTTGLRIPRCQAPGAAPDQWLAFPGGLSLDQAACVPLEVRVADQVTVVHIAVGTRCPH